MELGAKLKLGRARLDAPPSLAKRGCCGMPPMAASCGGSEAGVRSFRETRRVNAFTTTAQFIEDGRVGVPHSSNLDGGLVLRVADRLRRIARRVGGAFRAPRSRVDAARHHVRWD